MSANGRHQFYYQGSNPSSFSVVILNLESGLSVLIYTIFYEKPFRKKIIRNFEGSDVSYVLKNNLEFRTSIILPKMENGSVLPIKDLGGGRLNFVHPCIMSGRWNQSVKPHIYLRYVTKRL